MSVWIISVGSTDLQLPLYERVADEEGHHEWRLTHLVRLPERETRTIHEGLEKLAKFGLIEFIAPDRKTGALSSRRGKDEPRLLLEVNEDGSGFAARYESSVPPSETPSRLDSAADEISSGKGNKVPLALPKLEPILGFPNFVEDPPETVLVLNTRRTSDSREPVAAGPLVAKRMSLAFDLEWEVKGDPLHDLPRKGTATSVDFIRGTETFEADGDQEHCQQRLIALCRWIDEESDGVKVWLSNSGGAPQIKDLVGRTIQTYFGEGRVTVLTVPERSGDIQEQPLAQSQGWGDRDRVRVACATALRQRQLIAAFGLASSLCTVPSTRNEGWSVAVIQTLAPLCLLPNPPGIPVQDCPLTGSKLVAYRCEAALAQKDIKGALLHLGSLFETLHGELLQRHPLLGRPGITWEPSGRSFEIAGGIQQRTALKREVMEANELFAGPARGRQSPLLEWTGRFTARVRNTYSEMPEWLTWMERSIFNRCGPVAHLTLAATTLRALYRRYASVSKCRELRNQFVHHSPSQATLAEAQAILLDQALIKNDDGALTLLGVESWSKIFRPLGHNDLRDEFEGVLKGLLEKVRAPATGCLDAL